MPCSPARLEANRRNAARSTGPRTAEGKERSRANALTHGRAAEVVVPEAEADEVARREKALEGEMGPSGELGRIFVRRVAVLAARLDRCARHEAAMVARQVRDAEADEQDARLSAVEAMAEALPHAPSTHARRLRRTPEGLAWLIREWRAVQSDLFHPTRDVWNGGHWHRVENLMGRRATEYPVSAISKLCRAAWGVFADLAPEQGAGLDGAERQAWARAELGRVIDAEVATLEEERSALEARPDGAGATERALFDGGREASMARKYEAAAERGLYRALREFRQVEAEAEVARAPALPAEEAVESPDAAGALGSFGHDGEAAQGGAPGPFAPGGERGVAAASRGPGTGDRVGPGGRFGRGGPSDPASSGGGGSERRSARGGSCPEGRPEAGRSVAAN